MNDHYIMGEDRETPLWIHGHTPRIQEHPASARDTVSRSGALHISARCTRNRLVVLQHTKLRSLLSLSSAFDSASMTQIERYLTLIIRSEMRAFESFFKS
jgi:hypothetical protein